MTQFFYKQPVPIHFGFGEFSSIPQLVKEMHGKKGLIICSPSIVKLGLADKLKDACDGKIVAVFSDVQPNPTVKNTDDCVDLLRDYECDFAVAIGGGSVLDCAKVACAVANTEGATADYHTGGESFTLAGIPYIAVPTTSGTASEVTAVSVLTDTEKHVKSAVSSDFFYAAHAVVDPELTMSVPKGVTATSGIDVLAHSLEAFYGKKHQPITNALAEHAASLVFKYLLTAYNEPTNVEARTKMSEASVIAGTAFNLTQTAAAHACSYPLTNDFGVTHGEACAFTLPTFWRINSRDTENGERLQAFSKRLGFKDSDELADKIEEMKAAMGLRKHLKEVGVNSEEKLDQLVERSFSPNMANNPVEITPSYLKQIYEEIGY